MPKSGDRYEMPDGSIYELVTSHDDANGGYVEMEWTFPAGAFAPPAHIHPTQVEEYEVLEGSLEVMVDGDWQTLRTGDSASVPAGVTHTFKVPEPVRVRNFHRPGSHFDAFIEKQHAFVNSDRFKGLKHPSTAIAMAGAWQDHSDLLVATNPVLRAAMKVLAKLRR